MGVYSLLFCVKNITDDYITLFVYDDWSENNPILENYGALLAQNLVCFLSMNDGMSVM